MCLQTKNVVDYRNNVSGNQPAIHQWRCWVSAHFCSLIARIYEIPLQILFIRVIPLKFSRLVLLPLFCTCIGHMILSHQPDGKIPRVINLIKQNTKDGTISFNVALIISMHISSGPGERLECIYFILAMISSSVICRSRSIQSSFIKVS